MQPRNHFGFRLAQVRTMLVGAFAAIALTACGSSDEPQVAAPVPVKREQAPVDPTAKMARAVPVGSSTAPVNLKYEILNKPIVGSPVEIELAVIPTQHADSMTIGFAGSAGLAVSMDATPPIEGFKVGEAQSVKFSAQARQDAVYYVTVTATLYTAGTSEVRSFAIPLIISNPAPAADEAATPTAAAAQPKKT